jgi:hypothetical protein
MHMPSRSPQAALHENERPKASRLHAKLLEVLSLCLALGSGCHTPEVIVETSGDGSTDEAGSTVAVVVRLARRPSEPVTVRAVCSHPGEARVSAPVTFRRDDWQTPRTITITGVDDALPDGDSAYTVRIESLSGGQAPVTEELLELVNRDDDSVRFERLGDLTGGDVGSYVTAMSARGDVVVGYALGANGEEAVRFTSDGELVGLGAAPSRAEAVSANGTLVVGPATGDPVRAGAIWRADAPAQFLLGGPPGSPPPLPPRFTMVRPTGVLDDGRVFGSCVQYGAPERYGCRWDGPANVTVLFGASSLYAYDALGNYGGTYEGNRFRTIISVAVLNGRELGYPDGASCPGLRDCGSEIRAFSTGAVRSVGVARVPVDGALTDAAFVYEESGGMQLLPDLSGGAEESGAFAVSEDGRLIGGFGNDGAGRAAVLWIDGTLHRLGDLVAAAGSSLPSGFSLRDVRAVSRDLRTYAGNGSNDRGEAEGYRLTLPTAPR